MLQLSEDRKGSTRNITGLVLASGLSCVLWIIVLVVITAIML